MIIIIIINLPIQTHCYLESTTKEAQQKKASLLHFIGGVLRPQGGRGVWRVQNPDKCILKELVEMHKMLKTA